MGATAGHWVARCVLVLLLVSAGWAVCFNGTALGRETTTPAPEAPKLVAAQTTIRTDVNKPGLFDSSGTSGAANGYLLITNQGTGPATGIEVSGTFSDGTNVEVTATTPAGDALADVEMNDDVVISLTFSWAPGIPDTGTFVVKDEGGSGPPLTVPFTVRELVPGSVFGWAAFWSAVVAAALSLLTYASLKLSAETPRRRPLVSRVVFPVANWTFSGSWASTLTTVGALLGTLLAASGFLSDVLPGLATGLFLGVNIGYGLLAALAAVVYTASHDKDGSPTYLALLLAAFITLWAVIGELVTLAQLLARGGLPPPWIWIAGSIVLILLFLYERRSILQVLLAPKPPPPTPPPAPPPPAGPGTVTMTSAAAAAAAVETTLARLSVQPVGPSALL